MKPCGQASEFVRAPGAGAEKAGFLKPLASGRMPRIDHVGFGLVLGEDGKKIATRSGEVTPNLPASASSDSLHCFQGLLAFQYRMLQMVA